MVIPRASIDSARGLTARLNDSQPVRARRDRERQLCGVEERPIDPNIAGPPPGQQFPWASCGASRSPTRDARSIQVVERSRREGERAPRPSGGLLLLLRRR